MINIMKLTEPLYVKIVSEVDEHSTCKVVNIKNDETHDLFMPTIMYDSLVREYPDDSYVGKMFQITKLTNPNFKMSSFEVVEIEPTGRTV